VSVQDRGPGVRPEDQPRLFEAFFTTKPDGMGMGLFISRSIIEAHGGQLQMSAAGPPESGTIFHFTLPLSKESVSHEH
jgi:signal transduction histidine kinase